MVTILQGDCREVLKTLESKSVHCCVTSTPYYGLRDYQVADQIGLEQTPEIYVQNLVEVFREVRRVLRDDGTVWLNLGDSYASSTKGSGGHSEKQDSNKGSWMTDRRWKIPDDLKPKDLLGIPWRVAFALQSDGWYLRSDIIWHKPNPMPESVEDRPTTSHEYIFLLAKSKKYFYDGEAIKEPAAWERWGKQTIGKDYRGIKPIDMDSLDDRRNAGRNKRSVWTIATTPYTGAHFATYPPELIAPCIQAGTSEHGCCPKCGAPWERVIEKTNLVNESAKGSRFDKGKTAVNGNGRVQEGERFLNKTIGWQPTCNCGTEHKIPQEEIDADQSLLDDFEIEPLKPIHCTVLDPFAGSGTTGEVCEKLGRNSILIELNPVYIELIKQRTGQMGLFAG